MPDWPALMPDVAVALLGEPSSRTGRELRYGRRGSLSVDLAGGHWFDHEAGEGGGVVELVTRERGDVAEALALRISEHYHERAAVLEYDGERPRAEAEADALAAAWRPFH